MGLNAYQIKALAELAAGEWRDDNKNPKRTAVMRSLVRRGLVTEAKVASTKTPRVYRLA